jgi:hypothetical protein
MHRKHLLASLVITASLVADTARADDTARPLHAGQVVLDDLLGYRFGITPISAAGPAVAFFEPSGLLGFSHTETSSSTLPPGNPPLVTRMDLFSFSPSFDLLVTDHVSVGGTIEVENAHIREEGPQQVESNVFAITATPRIGYVVPLDDELALWPRASFGLGYAQQGDGSEDHANAWSASLELPLVARAGRHVLFMLGPELGVGASDDHISPDVSRLLGLSTSRWRAGMFTSLGMVF